MFFKNLFLISKTYIGFLYTMEAQNSNLFFKCFINVHFNVVLKKMNIHEFDLVVIYVVYQILRYFPNLSCQLLLDIVTFRFAAAYDLKLEVADIKIIYGILGKKS